MTDDKRKELLDFCDPKGSGNLGIVHHPAELPIFTTTTNTTTTTSTQVF